MFEETLTCTFNLHCFRHLCCLHSMAKLNYCQMLRKCTLSCNNLAVFDLKKKLILLGDVASKYHCCSKWILMSKWGLHVIFTLFTRKQLPGCLCGMLQIVNNTLLKCKIWTHTFANNNWVLYIECISRTTMHINPFYSVF